MDYCLVCYAELKPFFDLGPQPSANCLVEKHDLGNEEYIYPLQLGYCEKCKNVQTLTRTEKEEMFGETYSYFTSANQPMIEHFADTAGIIKDRFHKENFFIVEMGSNDGVFLKNFSDGHHLGIEPSKNVAFSARENGISCWTDFFNFATANRIVEDHGKADVVFAANVFAHVEDINSIVNGIKILLKPDGVFIFEIYYLPQMVQMNSFDLIYDEHIFFYTLTNLKNLFDRYDLEVFDIDHLSVHGGSIRGYVSHTGKYAKSRTYLDAFFKEQEQGYNSIDPLMGFSEHAAKVRTDLKALLAKLREEGKKVIGYGATAKSTTILNFCDINSDDIACIVDSTPFKQGKYTPGKNIEIRPESEFMEINADYTILFAWNYADIIMEKNKAYSDKGGKWILMHPEVRVI